MSSIEFAPDRVFGVPGFQDTWLLRGERVALIIGKSSSSTICGFERGKASCFEARSKVSSRHYLFVGCGECKKEFLLCNMADV